jgi:ubiquitin-activating enzyme E1
MDNIELSNLSRQFLFRQKDIQKPKAAVAAEAIRTLNPDIRINALTSKVGTETEHIFTAAFWQSLDVVSNALDNVPSRLYIDNQCVTHRKPLLECGTLGTKGNTQTVVPFVTENYGASADPPEKDLPMCSVRNLPYLIEHTIEYARSLFVEIFTDHPHEAASYATQPQRFLDRVRSAPNRTGILSFLVQNLTTAVPRSFDDCIAWARLLFEETFVNKIKQLLFNFPADAVTAEGVDFWSGKNKCPSPTPFDRSVPLHVEFVAYAAFVRASVYGLPVPPAFDFAHIAEVAAAVPVPEFRPVSACDPEIEAAIAPSSGSSSSPPVESPESGGKRRAAEGSEQLDAASAASAALADKASDDAEFASLLQQLPAGPALAAVRITPAEFEKDDDENHHIDFVTACANLRAINYGIPIAPRTEVKQISGKIVPALATTTALISGLTCFELAPLLAGANTLDAYRNWFVALSVNIYQFS